MKAMASLLLLCLLFVSFAGGCRRPGSPAATLSGKVTFKDEVLPGGTITFHPKEGAAISTTITGDGTYRVSVPFSGEASVTVATEHLNPDTTKIAKAKGEQAKPDLERPKITEEQLKKMSPEERARMELYLKPGGKQGGGAYKWIPEKYADLKKTPLSITIQGGSQVENFELKN